MPQVSFDQLPDAARLWIFAAERALTDGEEKRLLDEADEFLARWAAHGHPLTAARDWRHGRFLFVGVDEAAAGVSGCSVDALKGQLRTLGQELGIALIDNGPVVYREGDGIRRLSRAEFSKLAERGDVTPETTVYDNTLTSVGEVRAGRWEVSAATSWHGQVFFAGSA